VAEKYFVAELGGRPAPYLAVDTLPDLLDALDRLGTPAILKTRRLGYDGKGQVRLHGRHEAEAALAALGGGPGLVLEGLVTFTAEFSIILARGMDGAIAHYPPVLNRHQGGILSESRVPARDVPAAHLAEAAALAERIADALDYVGVLACEFFACSDGPVFNEMAPRVHNSGHWTIEGAITCQFEQHVRAIAGLPLGATDLVAGGAVLHNLLGEEALQAYGLLVEPGVHLHLYGKAAAAPGRKMGHVTRLIPWP
jgi:5-(carboxyamino)imidazole ribonucleotide synthase